ncbi:MAG: LuxR C-terminal-related transcriptional regulator, partial [Phototrophicaceae bacterium]
WIASLQMVAISLQRQTDKAQFIETFTGSHRYILDYLLEEVLQQQSEETRNFLLKTAILRRLNADLCDAVAQTNDSQLVLEQLEKRNLFIIPLDNTRQWYRYHHLFADLLRKSLEQSPIVETNTLHILASQWLEQNNQPHEAIHHALAAKDFELAADMIEQVWVASRGTAFQSGEQYRWMQSLPTSIYRNRPVLSAAYGWVLLDFGDLDAADERLRAAEYWLDADRQPNNAISEMIVVEQAEFQQLPATVAAARAFHALALGDVPNTIKYGQQVLVLVEKDDHHRRGIATSILGLAHWYMGNLEPAYQFMTAGMEHMMALGIIHFALSSTFSLADVRLGQGHLRDAIAIYKQSLQIAESQPYTVKGLADLYMGLGNLYREQNNLEMAQEYLLKSETLGKDAGLPDWRVRFCKVQTYMKLTLNEFDEALTLLDEAERLYYPTPVPNIRPIVAIRASVQIKQGELHSASIWASKQDLSLHSEVNYLNEFELMTLARLHIAQLKTARNDVSVQELAQLLQRLLDVAQAQQRMGSVIEISILQAQLHHLQGDDDSALDALEQALILAEPEGYIRIFIDEGAPMRELLSEFASRGILTDYVNQLLATFDFPDMSQTVSSQPLIDPLSERELEVLTLIAGGLSNRDISERLFIALDTVKGHNRIIYQKLQVSRRTEAVARARELGLI